MGNEEKKRTAELAGDFLLHSKTFNIPYRCTHRPDLGLDVDVRHTLSREVSEALIITWPSLLHVNGGIRPSVSVFETCHATDGTSDKLGRHR